MLGLVFIFIGFVIVLQYLSYKKVAKIDQKINLSIEQAMRFSAILEEIYEFSISTNFDYKERIFNLLLDFAYNLLEPHFLIFYVYDNDKKNFKAVDYRSKIKADFFMELSKIDDVLFDCLDSKDIEFFSKYESKNKEYFPLMSYFDTSVILKTIRIDDKPYGVFVFYADYSETYLNILRVVIEYITNSLRNVKLYRDVKEMSIDTIQTLGKVIDAKSNYTRKHTDRVALYSKAILDRIDYREYGVSNIEKFKLDVIYSAMLHDIGKVGISETILNKNTNLSDNEWDVMCTHPLIGEQIISPINFFKDICPIILNHHERYDGSGYLQGLKGKEIPLGARILAIADAYDAMTSDRSYRKAMLKTEAIAELQNNIAKQFDPKLLEYFFNYLEQEEVLV